MLNLLSLDVTCGMEPMHGDGVAGSKLTWA